MAKESSYIIPFIMPCFYSKNMDGNTDYFLYLFKYVKNEYDNFCKGKILDNNTSIFGFLLIFYYCLLKSTNLKSNNEVKLYYEDNFKIINSDIKGFDLKELKIEIENLIYDNKNTNGIDTIRQIYDSDIIFDNLNIKKGVDWFYEEFFNHCNEQKLNYDNKIRPHIFELKKVYFVGSKNFKSYCQFAYLFDILKINRKDFEYLYIDDIDKSKINSYNPHTCNCESYDCKCMIVLFNNEEPTDIIDKVGEDIENM